MPGGDDERLRGARLRDAHAHTRRELRGHLNRLSAGKRTHLGGRYARHREAPGRRRSVVLLRQSAPLLEGGTSEDLSVPGRKRRLGVNHVAS